MKSSSKIRVGVWGATGYTGHELVKILLGHPHAELSFLTAKIDADTPIAKIFPALDGLTDLVCHAGGDCQDLDVAFLALPHTISMKFVPGLVSAGIRVIDLSADYRLRDSEEYTKWYRAPHDDAEGLASAVYGLPEMFREDVKGASLVANPGCYPTAAALAILPLVESSLKPTRVIIDAKTGTSGAGRNPSLTLHFPECNESVKAYKVGSHQHEPEIGQVLADAFGQPLDVFFVPHLVPMDRGILSTCYVLLGSEPSEDELKALYADRYKDEMFVRVREDIPSTKDVLGMNFCDIGVRARGNLAVAVSCVDNLVKGAAGQAVQNMNIMFGFPEESGLLPPV